MHTTLKPIRRAEARPHSRNFVSLRGRPKVFVGMSGGVDSSVAALLLSSGGRSSSGGKNQGYDVAGVYLKCYVQPDGSCKRDAMDAMAVAKILGIPFEIWDFQEEYKKRVIGYMIEGYRQGITPNPDVACNREIKFGLFLKEALRRGAGYVATGHYIRLRDPKNPLPDPKNPPPKADPPLRPEADQPLAGAENASELPEVSSYSGVPFGKAFGYGTFGWNSGHSGRLSLFEAKDKNKDQSYFLWTLGQDQLQHCLFPIGDYLKSEVREIARKAGLPNADKKDSQGICFLGRVRLDEFLARHIEPRPGKVMFSAGNNRYEEVGEHPGAYLYTIGQRHGIGNIKHKKGMTKHAPLYVMDKDVRSNTVTVARREEARTVKEVELRDVNFVNPGHSHILPPSLKLWRTSKNVRMLDSMRQKLPELPDSGLPVLVRFRYRQPLVEARLCFSRTVPFDKSFNPALRTEGLRVGLIFNQPQRFVAPGQSAVFYVPDVDNSASAVFSREEAALANRGVTEDDYPLVSSGHRSNELRMLGGGVIL